MKTIDEQFRSLMKSVFDIVPEGSSKWNVLRLMFYAGYASFLTTMADAVKESKKEGKEIDNPLEQIAKEIMDFMNAEKTRKKIREDIRKAGE